MRIFVVLAVSLTFLAAAGAKTLQQAYDEAGPGEGYDKLLILDPGTTYTGGCNVLQGKKSCIRGNGALCDLNDGTILATGLHTDLHLSGCCLVDGNTICKGNMGVVVWLLSTATIKNNIIFGNAKYGIARHQNTPTLTILYNDVHNNPGGNYMYLCVG